MASKSEFADTVAMAPPEAPADGSGQVDAGADAIELEFDEALAPAMSADTENAPTLSHVGRYALKRPLGSGGLGTVFEAWDPMLSRAVAVKTLQFGGDDSARDALDTLFLNEARAVAGLNHPHIVTVFDAGLSDQGVYVAMERLVGRDMRMALSQGWQPPAVAAAQIARRVADALAYAHEQGVIHCDIKPANIFLSPRGKPTVLDFGIARAAHDASPSIFEGMVAGSPHYLAPEQLAGEAIDERTDVYALGVVLYELLAGRKAFDGATLEQIVNAVQHSHPAPAHEVRPGVSRSLSMIAHRAMAKAPEERHASAAELSRALRQWIERHGRAARRKSNSRRGFNWMPWVAAAGAAGLVLALGIALKPQKPAPVTDSLNTPAAVTTTTAGADDGSAVTAPVGVAPELAASEPAAAPAEVAEAPAKPVARTKPRKRKAKVETPAAPPPMGVVQLAVSPWGEIEVDGAKAGLTPPLSRLELSAGEHRITVRNGQNPPFVTTITVDPAKPVVVRHRFGS